LGEKWENVKRCLSFTFHWPPSNGTFQGPLNNGTFQGPPNNGTFQGPPNNGTFQGPLNNGTFQGPPNNGTFHWPPSWDLPSRPSFSIFLRGRIRIIGGLLIFFEHNFQFKS